MISTQEMFEMVKEDSFIKEYSNQLNCKELLESVPGYSDERYRIIVAYNMIVSVAKGTSNWDVYANNPAIRRAGKKFGCKTSKEFRETIRELWKNGWLQNPNIKMVLA